MSHLNRVVWRLAIALRGWAKNAGPIVDSTTEVVTGGLLVLWVAALGQQIPDGGVDLNSRNA